MSDMLDAALDAARSGWAVHPLTGKRPLTPNGFKDASTDPEIIASWWRRWPSANIGIALPTSVIVIDVDPRHGGSDSLAALTAQHGPLPQTLTAISGRQDGGCHLYLRHPGGKLTDRMLGDGIDLRAGGKHYVAAPPSIHPETGHPYAWANDAPIAWPPPWLVDLLHPAPTPLLKPDVPDEAGKPDGDRGDALVRHVAGLQPGNRNNGLFWAACRAADDGLLDGLVGRLSDAALSIGLDPAEVAVVLRSARGRRAA